MRTSLTIFILLLSNLILFAQNDLTPLDLTRKYFNRELKNYKSVLIGEAKEQNFNPKEISKNAKFKFEILSYSENKAVIAISIKDNNNYQDLYAFWIKDNDWKIKAFRALWLPGMFYGMLDKYKDLDSNGIKQEYEKMIKETKARNDTISIQQIVEALGTIDDFQFEIKNMKLTVATDSILIDHFSQNKDKFDSLLTKIKKDTVTNSEMWRLDSKSTYKGDMHAILVASISNYDDNKLISFIIGGMIDNSVGYFYCENINDLPEMTDNRYIMIRKLGNGWYLYKTT